MVTDTLFDCVIIGGGIAGLTAGVYLGRYRRKAIIYDTVHSRAALIPLSHNYPGFPDGIAGKDLLNRLRHQVSLYQVPLIEEAIQSLEKNNEDCFLLRTTSSTIRAKYIILCTGVKDIEPQVGHIKDGIQKGLIRHCPVCDAYEIMNKKVAVIGSGKKGLGEALFLRDYTEDVNLITLGKKQKWAEKELNIIEKSQIKIWTEEVQEIELSSHLVKIRFSDRHFIPFDSLYSALGSIKNNKLALDLQVKLRAGSIVVNKDHETSVKGLFAAGDIVSGLNQMCVAASQAAIAATAIHTRCREYKT